MKTIFRSLGIFVKAAALVAVLALVACNVQPGVVGDNLSVEAKLVPATKSTDQLALLPPPRRPVDVAVYAFTDKTGQNKPSDNFAQFSRAVTQGPESILIDVLSRAGQGKWFKAIERAGLQNLLQERNIIEQTRKRYNSGQSDLPPLRFAGILIEGGIVSYDSNVITGGAGARLLGVGASVKYRRDVVTVALRAVSVSSGEVLVTVTTTKTIYSALASANAFLFVAVDEIFEADAGYSRNEPVGLAVRQAIELGVYALVMQGVKKGVWSFADSDEGQFLIDEFDAKYQRSLTGTPRSQVSGWVPQKQAAFSSATGPKRSNVELPGR